MKTRIYFRFAQTLLFCVLFASGAFAQSGTLKGKITDSKTKDPIPFASVVLEKGGKQIAGTTSDFNGDYTIKPIPPGTYDLRASFVGYSTVFIKGIVISPDKYVYQDISLEVSTTTLSCVIVADYQVKLISKDQTTSGQNLTKSNYYQTSNTNKKTGYPYKTNKTTTGQTLTTKEISKMPGRDAGSIAITTGGTYSTSEKLNDISVKGSRNEGYVTYIDGVKVIGNSAIPKSAIDQVNVMTGGLPPSYEGYTNNNNPNTLLNNTVVFNNNSPAPVTTPNPPVYYPYYEYNTESYIEIIENDFEKVSDNPLSTFSIDVDDASYSNMRRFVMMGLKPPPDAVRTEEFINYFNYDYPAPQGDEPYAIYTEVGLCPWNSSHKLVHIGIQGKQMDMEKLPKSNLVFLIDVSGSMYPENKLPLVKKSLKLLVDQMRETDKIAIVVYASASGLVLESTSCKNKQKIHDALDKLEAGGSTAGGEGIILAYKIAKENFIESGNNRVIIATDGDFNVGPSSDADMEKLITEKRKSGVFLSVLGYGMGNYKDSKMEKLADKGNGNYAYIDNLMEAHRVLVKEMGSTLFTIAKDVKIQVEFNPANVKAYRLIGYEDRLLEDEDFNNDTVDAGELGAGSSVTALYEIITSEAELKDLPSVDPLKYQQYNLVSDPATQNELLTVKIRYKKPKETLSKLTSGIVYNKYVDLNNASDNYKFSAAVVEFCLLLRNSKFKETSNFEEVLKLAREGKGKDADGYRAEFIKLVEMTSLIK